MSRADAGIKNAVMAVMQDGRERTFDDVANKLKSAKVKYTPELLQTALTSLTFDRHLKSANISAGPTITTYRLREAAEKEIAG